MSFHETLAAATQAEREFLLTAPVIREALTGTINRSQNHQPRIMSHIEGIDVIDFVLLTIYPVAALFLVEMLFRVTKLANWMKLFSQAIVSIGFGIAYLTLITAHG